MVDETTKIAVEEKVLVGVVSHRYEVWRMYARERNESEPRGISEGKKQKLSSFWRF